MNNPVTLVISLPEFFNLDENGDAEKIPEEDYEQTVKELVEDLMISEGGIIHSHFHSTGIWFDVLADRLYGPEEIRLIQLDDVLYTDSSKNDFHEYAKKVLTKRFKQKAIYYYYVLGIEPHLAVAEEQ